MQHRLIILLVVPFSLLGCTADQNDLIQCFSCNSRDDANCGQDLKLTSQLGDCYGHRCTKTVIVQGNSTQITRGCTPSSDVDNECTTVANGNVSTTECICQDSVCNSASRTGCLQLPLFLLILLVAVIANRSFD